MKNRLLFLDAETDGLYGPLISVAMIVTDMSCNEVERYYYGIDKSKLVVTEPWVIENVLPKLGEYEPCNDENELLERVWAVWEKYSGCAYAIADVAFPVEAGLLRKCVELDRNSRMFNAPFPLMDLSSILYAKGINPLIDKPEILGKDEGGDEHNALYDVEQAIKVYKKVMEV